MAQYAVEVRVTQKGRHSRGTVKVSASSYAEAERITLSEIRRRLEESGGCHVIKQDPRGIFAACPGRMVYVGVTALERKQARAGRQRFVGRLLRKSPIRTALLDYIRSEGGLTARALTRVFGSGQYDSRDREWYRVLEHEMLHMAAIILHGPDLCDNATKYEVFSAVFEGPTGEYLGVTMPLEEECYSDLADAVSALAPALMGGGTAGMPSSYDESAVRSMDDDTILEANEWLVCYADELAILWKALVDSMTRRMGRRIREDRNAYVLIRMRILSGDRLALEKVKVGSMKGYDPRRYASQTAMEDVLLKAALDETEFRAQYRATRPMQRRPTVEVTEDVGEINVERDLTRLLGGLLEASAGQTWRVAQSTRRLRFDHFLSEDVGGRHEGFSRGRFVETQARSSAVELPVPDLVLDVAEDSWAYSYEDVARALVEGEYGRMLKQEDPDRYRDLVALARQRR
jgi:hypothetical protein